MKRPLAIAQVVPTFPPYRGGTGVVAYEYTVRLRARGHRVDVFTPQTTAPCGDVQSVHHLKSIVRFGNAAFVPSVYRQLNGFDVIHLHLPFFGGAEPVLCRCAMHPSQALLVSYHMDASAGGIKGLLFRFHERALLPSLLTRADRVLVSSMDYARQSAARGVTEPDRLEVHPYGVDIDRFHPGRSRDLRSTLRLSDDDVVLLFVGRFDAAHHFKGFEVLQEVLRERSDVGWHLVVVGDGPKREAHERRASASGFAARVHFVGDVPSSVLPDFYRLADVHVFPSTGRSEAFGLVCLEAAASGIPTIASDLPGVRTVVRNLQTGLLVPPGDASALRDAISTLASNKTLRTTLGLAARERAESDFAWEPLVTRLEETCRQTVKARTGQLA